jgi:hypothetical protein
MNKEEPLKKSWEERFDEIGFGNQAVIVGTKRVELKDFIHSALEEQRKDLITEIKKKLPNGQPYPKKEITKKFNKSKVDVKDI